MAEQAEDTADGATVKVPPGQSRRHVTTPGKKHHRDAHNRPYANSSALDCTILVEHEPASRLS